MALNESPSEKEGKFHPKYYRVLIIGALNESPSEKEGKSWIQATFLGDKEPSMKVPTKK